MKVLSLLLHFLIRDPFFKFCCLSKQLAHASVTTYNALSVPLYCDYFWTVGGKKSMISVSFPSEYHTS